MFPPSITLLSKLGSIVIHIEEFLSKDGDALDRAALDALLNDNEVKNWILLMNNAALIPVKRK